ncbi:hypothetical protein [Lysobacter terrae]
MTSASARMPIAADRGRVRSAYPARQVNAQQINNNRNNASLPRAGD